MVVCDELQTTFINDLYDSSTTTVKLIKLTLVLCAAVMKHMSSATFLEKNVGKDVKNGLIELEDLLDHISYYKWTEKATEDAQKQKQPHPR